MSLRAQELPKFKFRSSDSITVVGGYINIVKSLRAYSPNLDAESLRFCLGLPL